MPVRGARPPHCAICHARSRVLRKTCSSRKQHVAHRRGGEPRRSPIPARRRRVRRAPKGERPPGLWRRGALTVPGRLNGAHGGSGCHRRDPQQVPGVGDRHDGRPHGYHVHGPRVGDTAGDCHVIVRRRSRRGCQQRRGPLTVRERPVASALDDLALGGGRPVRGWLSSGPMRPPVIAATATWHR